MSATIPRYVVDASIAIKWFSNDEEFIAESRQLLYAYREGLVSLIAPDHLYHEVLNALRTEMRMKADCPLAHADRRLRNTLRGQFTHELWIDDYTS